MKSTIVKAAEVVLLGALVLGLGACSAISPLFNPFYETPSAVASQGELSDRALKEDGTKDNTAREALQAMSSYQAALPAQPVNPVLQPAVVRLMWVPDHLNRNGDLVPAHYYYLKVLSDRWAVSDAFELEAQLNGPKGKGATDNMPFVYDAEVKK